MKFGGFCLLLLFSILLAAFYSNETVVHRNNVFLQTIRENTSELLLIFSHNLVSARERPMQ